MCLDDHEGAVGQPMELRLGSANSELYPAVETENTLGCEITLPICQINWTSLGEGGLDVAMLAELRLQRYRLCSLGLILFYIVLARLHDLLNK